MPRTPVTPDLEGLAQDADRHADTYLRLARRAYELGATYAAELYSGRAADARIAASYLRRHGAAR